MPTTLAGWLALLEKRHPVAVDLGLERCQAVWQRMGKPQPAPRIFVVAGTNGKGSTVATICSLLGALGHRHGSYTTPHLLHYNERIRVQGQAVSDTELLRAFAEVEAARGPVSLSYFEFGTLAAFSILARAGVEFAVMEIGLGGRLDAVNVLDADCAVITPIGLDHQDYLGDDLESIAFEKAGIIRDGRPVICGESQPPNSIVDVAADCNAPLLRLGIDFTVRPQKAQTLFAFGGRELLLPGPALAGTHQLGNMATGLAATLQLLPGAWCEPQRLAQGLRAVRLRGRLEKVLERPPVWVDVGHNPMAATAVAETLRQRLRDEGLTRCSVVLAMLADKDAASVAGAFSGIASRWYLAGLDGDRGQSGDRLAEQVAPVIDPDPRRVFDDVQSALDAALEEARDDEGILVFGSFLTAADALQHRILLESSHRSGKRVN